MATAQTPSMKVMSFGGSDQDSLGGFAIDRQGNYYVAGTTASFDLPVNTLQKQPGGASLYRFRAGRMDPLHPAAAPSAIALDSSRPGTLYAAYARAIWKSTDSGDTWQHLEADWPADYDCISIAVAPNNSSTVYVLCQGNNYPVSPPQHLLRSADAGLTWTRIFVGPRHLQAITVDPYNPQAMLAAGYNGAQFSTEYGYRSADGGETWAYIGTNLLQFAFDDLRPGIAYATGFDGLYWSRDSGQSWTKIPNPPQPQISDFYYFQTASIAVLPSGDLLFLLGNTLYQTHNGTTWQGHSAPGDRATCRFSSPDSALRVDPRSGSIYLEACVNAQSAVYRSDDGGATWVRLNGPGLPDLRGHVISPTAGGSDYFVIVRKSFDAFVAKLSPTGDMLWSTYLGGAHDETVTGLAIDAGNNVYVMGTTVSDDFTFTSAPLANPLLAPLAGAKSFIAKLSPDGMQLLYSAVFAYDATARGIATDPSGAVYITGNAGPSLPTTPGVIRPVQIGNGANAFILKLDSSGPRVIYGTYLADDSYTISSPPPSNIVGKFSILANAITVDADGNAYAGGTYIWKLNSDASALVYSTKLDDGAVNDVAVDAGTNLYVTGAASTISFVTTPGAFQTHVLPTACGYQLITGFTGCWASPAFVTKFDPSGQTLFSTYLGGDGWDVGTSLAVAGDGTVYAAGHTNSRSFPTRLPIQGPMLPLLQPSGFVTALTPDASDVTMSTYVGDGRALQPVAVALDPTGAPVLAGHNIAPSPNGGGDVPNSASDILIFRLDYSNGENVQPRLDAIVNAASRIGTALAPGQRVALQGAGFDAGAEACFNDECFTPLDITGEEILIAPPASLPPGGPVQVSVRLTDGRRSNEVLMPVGPAALALYSADNSGAGGVLALNADGTFNSPSNPARRGTSVTVPANGVDLSATIHVGYVGLSNEWVSVGPFPSLPGEVPLVHATIDRNLQFSVPAIPMTGYSLPGHQPVTLFVDLNSTLP